VISKLLREAASLYGDHRLASSTDLQKAVKELKDTITASSGPTARASTTEMSYANAARRGIGGTTNLAVTPKQRMAAEMQQKQIFISLKNIVKDAQILKWDLDIITRYCNDIISNYFVSNPGNNPPTHHPLRGIAKSAAGNITLTFKTVDDANKARAHADQWVQHIDPQATTPQRSYAVVAHNASTYIWTGSDDLADAIEDIETRNADNAPDGKQIANLAWLNSIEARNMTKRGPLMISYRTKAAANAAIENSIVIEGTICSVSLYIPRPPQCFRCQDWGHRAAGCTGEARCGRCAGPHTTADHLCSHEHPCPTGQRCNIDKPKMHQLPR
jgi:hypothetical protein